MVKGSACGLASSLTLFNFILSLAPQFRQLLEQATYSEQCVLLRGMQEGMEKLR